MYIYIYVCVTHCVSNICPTYVPRYLRNTVPPRHSRLVDKRLWGSTAPRPCNKMWGFHHDFTMIIMCSWEKKIMVFFPLDIICYSSSYPHHTSHIFIYHIISGCVVLCSRRDSAMNFTYPLVN